MPHLRGWVLTGPANCGNMFTPAIDEGLSHASRGLKRHFALVLKETFPHCKAAQEKAPLFPPTFPFEDIEV